MDFFTSRVRHFVIIIILLLSSAFAQKHMVSVDADTMAMGASFSRKTLKYASGSTWSSYDDYVNTQTHFAFNYAHLLQKQIYLKAAFTRKTEKIDTGESGVGVIESNHSMYLAGAQFYFGKLVKSFYTQVMVGWEFIDYNTDDNDFSDRLNVLYLDFGKRFSLKDYIKVKNVFYSPGLTYMTKNFDGDNGRAFLKGSSSTTKSIFDSSSEIIFQIFRVDFIF
ncbi:hypothetical protein N9N67_05470 [Bacteriovoracaceae bacterium]|nr:hypothetical protein [Bacteriovoracaceae bacterium]